MNLENRFFYRIVVFFRITLISLAAIGCISFSLWNLTPDYFQNSKIGYPIISTITGYKIPYINGMKYYPVPALSPDAAEYDYMIKINSPMTPKENKKMATIGLHTGLELAATAIICFMMLYALLNVFCDSLLYLAFGRKPSWRWILFLNDKKVRTSL